MVRYIKCPRCELNYIDAEKQEYCDVCLKELSGVVTDMEDEIEEEVLTELCPVCGENMMRAGDKMCEECRKRADYDEKDPDPDKDDEEWRNYLDDDTFEEEEDIKIDETFDDGFEEEEEEEYNNDSDDEDMEYVTGDDIYKLGDDDEDDEDDSDDDF